MNLDQIAFRIAAIPNSPTKAKVNALVLSELARLSGKTPEEAMFFIMDDEVDGQKVAKSIHSAIEQIVIEILETGKALKATSAEAHTASVESLQAAPLLKQQQNPATGSHEWALFADDGSVTQWFGKRRPSDEAVAKAGQKQPA